MADINKPLNITATPPPVAIPTNPLRNVGISSGSVSANLPAVADVTGKADVTTIAVAIRGMGEENIPDPRLFKFLADKFGVSEQALLDAYKNIPELVRGTDLRSVIARKVLAEVADAYEEVRLQVRTGRQEVSAVTDIAYRALAKPTTSSGKVSEEIDKRSKKLVLETKTITDRFSKHVAIALAEADYFFQDYTLEKYSSQKGVRLSDALARVVQYKRTLNSIVDATDDFYGLANLDDDQIATFHKVLADWIDLTETLVFWVQKTLASTIRPIDQPSLSSDKTLLSSTSLPDTGIVYSAQNVLQTSYTSLDTYTTHPTKVPDEDNFLTYDRVTKRIASGREDVATNQDQSYVRYTAVKLDQAAAIDTLLSASGKVLLDTKSAIDAFTHRYSKPFSDTTSSGEVARKQYYKNLFNSGYFLRDYAQEQYGPVSERAVYTSDYFSKVATFTRNFTDLVDATDDFYGAANIDDDQVSAFGKSLADTYAISDSVQTQTTFMREFASTVARSDSISNWVYQKFIPETAATSERTVFNSSKVATDRAALIQILHLNVQNYSLERYAAVDYVGQTFTY